MPLITNWPKANYRNLTVGTLTVTRIIASYINLMSRITNWQKDNIRNLTGGTLTVTRIIASSFVAKGAKTSTVKG